MPSVSPGLRFMLILFSRRMQILRPQIGSPPGIRFSPILESTASPSHYPPATCSSGYGISLKERLSLRIIPLHEKIHSLSNSPDLAGRGLAAGSQAAHSPRHDRTGA